MHVDPELLSLLALGEHEGDPGGRQHVDHCLVCAAELAELQHVVTLGRGVDASAALVRPSPDVWARIRGQLAIDPSIEPSADAAIEPEPEPAEQGLTAHATLAPVNASWSQASGTAELGTDELGRRLLRVALSAELPTSGVRQAWLVHRDDPSLRQTLGILDGPYGLWTVDQAIDLEQFAILDISQQGTGETEHSGHTIVRGELTLAS